MSSPQQQAVTSLQHQGAISMDFLFMAANSDTCETASTHLALPEGRA